MTLLLSGLLAREELVGSSMGRSWLCEDGPQQEQPMRCRKRGIVSARLEAFFFLFDHLNIIINRNRFWKYLNKFLRRQNVLNKIWVCCYYVTLVKAYFVIIICSSLSHLILLSRPIKWMKLERSSMIHLFFVPPIDFDQVLLLCLWL